MVIAYRLNGDRVCLAGLGTGASWGHFPRTFAVRIMKHSGPWIKILKQPEEGEKPVEGKHWDAVDPIAWAPVTVLLDGVDDQGRATSMIGCDMDTIGDATKITLLDTDSCITVTEEACAEVDDIETPRSGCSDAWREF